MRQTKLGGDLTVKFDTGTVHLKERFRELETNPRDCFLCRSPLINRQG
jgi:hypothetical protein